MFLQVVILISNCVTLINVLEYSNHVILLLLYREIVSTWRKRNIHIMAWTMESSAEAEQYKKQFNTPVLMDYKKCTC